MNSVAIIGTRGYPSFYGGFETAVRELAPYLADHGWQVTVYGRGPVGSSNVDDIEVVNTRGLETKSLSTLSYGLTATLHASRRRPDVALIMNVANGFWLPLLRLRGIPTLVNVDGIEWERAKWGTGAKLLFRLGAHLTARLATELVVDAKAIGARWKREFNRSGVFIPYGGTVDADGFTSEASLGLASRSYVLAVARLVPENSIDQFLDTVRQLPADVPVVLVGSSGYGSELDDAAHKLASERSNFHWLGHVSDDDLLFNLWRHCGVYFHGHTVGGTNPALVQAMMLGAPVIARDTDYNRETLGESGIFVSGSPAALATSIEQVLGDIALQDRLRTGGKTRALADYSWAGVCRAYEAALRALIRV